MNGKRWVAGGAGLAVLGSLLVVVNLANTAATVPTMLSQCQGVSLDANGVGVGGAGYSVVSFNIRGAQLSASSAGMAKHAGDYKWSKRGPVVVNYLRALDADIVGLQENGIPPGGNRRQLATIKAGLPGYTWIGADRPIPLGIRTTAFTILDQGRVRLSTAGVAGATGDRFAVWAKLRATSDGTDLLAINLHSQHGNLKQAAKARRVGWTKLTRALKTINPDNRLPTVMVGDFNASSNETRPVFNDHLVQFGEAGFVDAAAVATRIAPIANVTSFNGFGDTIGGRWYYKSINRNSTGSHIDYVWTAGAAKATTWQIYTGLAATWKTIKGRQVPFADFIPSDHWPVIAKVKVGTAATSGTDGGDPQMSLEQPPEATAGGFGLPRPGQPRQQSLRWPAVPIPPRIKGLYLAAGSRYGLPWQLLAGIGMAETRHGANNNTSSAGAQGLMQFMPNTFAHYGVDGDGDGLAHIRNDADSVFSAANYLVASGAKKGQQGVVEALMAYNRSTAYGNDVLFYAWSYAGAAGIGGADPAACSGSPPILGGEASGQWADVINFGLSLVGRYPYSWGGGGLNGPTLGTGRSSNTVGFDCSSFTRFIVYQKTGVVLPRDSRSQARFFQQRGLITRTNNWRELQAGDIVFYSHGSSLGSIYHVATVTKPGWIVEEPGFGRYVQHNPLERRMPGDIWGYARVDLASLKANN
mgnify:CR=1 FL=1